MTPKERRDAQVELRDWATELDYTRAPKDMSWRDEPAFAAKNRSCASLLRAVATELDCVPEEQ